jgi:probable F420-dependent oxidoreductase
LKEAAMTHKARFSVVLPNNDFVLAREMALKAEALGFDGIAFDDHFFMRGIGRDVTEPHLECFTALSALASLTKRVKLGQVVTANSYRHPALLAKMTATLDVISGGRLELGIGAGWFREEYEAYGYPYPGVRMRIAQLREAIQVITQMWTEEAPSFTGEHYQIRQAYNFPKPAQKPRPKIMVGGSGKDVLRVTAELADIANVIPPLGARGTPDIKATIAFGRDEFKRRLDYLRQHCRDLGRNFDEIEKSGACFVLLGNTEAEVETIAQVTAQMMGVEDTDAARRSPLTLIGTPDQCVEILKARIADLGVTYYTCTFLAPEALDQFGRQILPYVR